LKVDGVGPKKALLFWRELGVTGVPELKAAAEAGKLAGLPGMGAKSEARVLAGVAALSRRATGRVSIGRAWPAARDLLARLRGLPGVQAAEVAGSLRRWRPTIGDVDLLAAASDPVPVMAAFVGLPQVIRVLGHGETKSSVELANGLRVQLWVHPPERFGAALQYATGSKEHNVRLRELALKRGLSLSEHGLTREDGSEILCATEPEVYAALGLPFIAPELREDRGEIQAALAGALPRLLALDEVRADLHNHSTWSDGAESIEAMARAALARGLRVLAITDHSQSLCVTGGLSPEKLREQRAELDAVQDRLGDRLLLLQGAEVEIRADGALDYDDRTLAGLDIVVASVHTSLRQERERITARLLAAVRNPHVDIIGHPTGQLIGEREPADLDMEAVLAAAAESGVALEINANPARLDLNDGLARRALELGCTLSINTDSHHAEQFALMEYGVATARRAWAGAAQVINTWEPDRLRAWLRRRE
ncbi:MAG: DNA polymerase/3'-5' exonuclease PolX, partial [Chloroflexi bacterium]|nr:DNA polymerase/3'-5' exonuclease PolX [Chloroflexota bacterium]